MTAPVGVAFNHDQTRAAFTLFHEKGNIITAAMVDALRSGLEAVAGNPSLKLITIEGSGRDFSFGASIPEHAPDRIGEVLPAMHQLVFELLDAPAITAAVVRGRCLGGGFELALACDFIVASSDAVFGLPEVTLGVVPPAACALVPLRAGAARATRAIVTGENQPAGAWHDAGVVELVAPPEELLPAIDGWYERHLATKSASALRYAAAAARMSLAAAVRGTLPGLEHLYLDDLMRTHDAVEGVAAFMDRRPPEWKNR